LLDDAVLQKIAKKHGKSTAQVTLRWELQNGIITIPKSTHKEGSSLIPISTISNYQRRK